MLLNAIVSELPSPLTVISALILPIDVHYRLLPKKQICNPLKKIAVKNHFQKNEAACKLYVIMKIFFDIF